MSDAASQVPIDECPVVTAAAIAVHEGNPAVSRVYRFPLDWMVHFYRHHGEVRIDGQAFAIRPGDA